MLEKFISLQVEFEICGYAHSRIPEKVLNKNGFMVFKAAEQVAKSFERILSNEKETKQLHKDDELDKIKSYLIRSISSTRQVMFQLLVDESLHEECIFEMDSMHFDLGKNILIKCTEDVVILKNESFLLHLLNLGVGLFLSVQHQNKILSFVCELEEKIKTNCERFKQEEICCVAEQSIVQYLCGIGYQRNGAMRAAIMTKNRSCSAALSYAIAHERDENFNWPIISPKIVPNNLAATEKIQQCLTYLRRNSNLFLVEDREPNFKDESKNSLNTQFKFDEKSNSNQFKTQFTSLEMLSDADTKPFNDNSTNRQTMKTFQQHITVTQTITPLFPKSAKSHTKDSTKLSDSERKRLALEGRRLLDQARIKKSVKKPFKKPLVVIHQRPQNSTPLKEDFVDGWGFED